jgi:hypothetical protein
MELEMDDTIRLWPAKRPLDDALGFLEGQKSVLHDLIMGLGDAYKDETNEPEIHSLWGTTIRLSQTMEMVEGFVITARIRRGAPTSAMMRGTLESLVNLGRWLVLSNDELMKEWQDTAQAVKAMMADSNRKRVKTAEEKLSVPAKLDRLGKSGKYPILHELLLRAYGAVYANASGRLHGGLLSAMEITRYATPEIQEQAQDKDPPIAVMALAISNALDFLVHAVLDRYPKVDERTADRLRLFMAHFTGLASLRIEEIMDGSELLTETQEPIALG